MQASNTKVMREALEHVEKLAREFAAGNYYVSDFPKMLLDAIRPALAAPPRNCDVQFLDRVEMYGAFKDWCNARGHTMEPKLAYDAFDWLLALATEKKGGAK